MTTLPKGTHPSNRLYRGEVTDFIDAMDTYRRQMEYENEVTRQLSHDLGQPITDHDRKLMSRLMECAKKADEASAIYNRHVKAAEGTALAELRAKGGEEFTAFADALESGDYSNLAI